MTRLNRPRMTAFKPTLMSLPAQMRAHTVTGKIKIMIQGKGNGQGQGQGKGQGKGKWTAEGGPLQHMWQKNCARIYAAPSCRKAPSQ